MNAIVLVGVGALSGAMVGCMVGMLFEWVVVRGGL